MAALSRLPSYCPGFNPGSSFPSLKHHNVRGRTKRYRNPNSTVCSYICGSGYFSEHICVKDMTDRIKPTKNIVEYDAKHHISSAMMLHSQCQWNPFTLCQDTLTKRKQRKQNDSGSKPRYAYQRWFDLGRKLDMRSDVVIPFTSLLPYFEKVQQGEQVSTSEKMTYEGLRLQSFHKVKTNVSALTLAEAGFFATGEEHETQCYSCGMIYRHWHQNDNPKMIHQQLSPNCKHVHKLDTRNVPILHPSATVQSAAESLCDTNSPRVHRHGATTSSQEVVESGETERMTNTTRNNDAGPYAMITGTETTAGATADCGHDTVNIVDWNKYSQAYSDFENAVYPHYKDENKRLETFQFWPQNHCKKPAELVFVGFFYAGYSDCVRCFVCGIGLRTWEEGDDPWVEHVRWRSSCDFVSKVRGQDFVIQILATLGKEMTETNPPLDILKTDVCQRALSMGFSQQSVKTAACDLSKSAGRNNLDLSTLLERVLCLPEKGPETTKEVQNTKDNETVKVEVSSADKGHVNKEAAGAGVLSTMRQAGERCSGTDTVSLQATVEENRQMRESSLCKICLDESSNIVFLPCGHLVACVTCSPALERCPVCRQHIRGTVRVHLTTMSSAKSP